MTCEEANVLLKISLQQLHARDSRPSCLKSLRIRPHVLKKNKVQNKILQRGWEGAWTYLSLVIRGNLVTSSLQSAPPESFQMKLQKDRAEIQCSELHQEIIYVSYFSQYKINIQNIFGLLVCFLFFFFFFFRPFRWKIYGCTDVLF